MPARIRCGSMRNVRDRQDLARHLWGAAKFPSEFGALNTTAQKADAQVMALICGHADDGQASGRRLAAAQENGSRPGILVKRITGNHAAEKAPGMAVAGRPRLLAALARRPPERLAAGGH